MRVPRRRRRRGADPGREVEVEEDLGDALRAQCSKVVKHLLARPLEWPTLPAGVVVNEVDEAAHDDPHGLGVAPSLARALAHRLDARADPGEVLPAAADPALGEPPGAAQCRRSHAAEQHRWVRTLHGRRAHVRARHRVELAGELDRVLRPQRLQAAQVLVHPRAPPPEGHTGGGILLRQPADPEPDGEPATGQHVQRRQRLREQHGVR